MIKVSGEVPDTLINQEGVLLLKNVLFLSLIGMLMVVLVGCGSNGKSAGKTAKELGLDVTKKTETFSVKLTSAKIVENELNTDVNNVTLELGVEAKNISKEEAGIGTGDFTIKAEDGKTYTYTGSEKNFGDVIKPEGDLKGKGYYSIPKNSKKVVVIYKPHQSTEQLKWDIEIPEKTK